VQACVEFVLREFGRVDILINNAGNVGLYKSLEITQGQWEQVLQVNLISTFMCSQAFGREMIRQQQGGAIVNVSSIASLSTFPLRASYGAAKAGINLLTKVLAVEWAPFGIRVNAIAPGMTRTERGADLAKISIGSLNESAFIPRIPLGRIASPSETANVAVFLASDDAEEATVIADDIVARGLATPNEIGTMSELARMTYEILAHAWRRRDTLLVDLKIEFGRIVSGEGKGSLVIADVIDNDSWRVWPQGREDLMLDKQMYRNLDSVTPNDLMRVRESYERVADAVGTFPQMRPGMVAILVDGAHFAEVANNVARAVGGFGLPTVRHIVSVERTPGYILQLIAQLDATFARMVVITVGAPGSALFGLVDKAPANPRLKVETSGMDLDATAFAAAKALALEDTIVFGRVLLMQANVRSSVMQADAQLQAAQQAQVPPGANLA